MTTPIAAPADAPIGPNIEPAFAPSMAELTASMATFKPSAIPDIRSLPKASPNLENVSERNCPACMISLIPASISAKPSFSLFVSSPAENTFLRPFDTLLKDVSI